MAKAIMIQGTCSNAGKSFLTAALCRIFAQDGYRVAPFKAQNMALNSFITAEGLEMGRAQVLQAQAAGIAPSVLMNPILLKPSSDTGSQVIVGGEVLGHYAASDYYRMKPTLLPRVREAYEQLAERYDVIVIEGAGSPAEINLREHDLVNMGMARIAKAPVLLAGDIDRGGVFASLAGTLLLLTEEERAMVKGLLINRFRGDRALLEPGVRMLEELVHRPVLGVIPYLHLDLEDEDSLTDRFTAQGTPGAVEIAVIRLPRISNFTDFNPLSSVSGVCLRYVERVRDLGSPDLIILPGSKNTMEDLLWLRQNGLEAAILKHAAAGGGVMGICGGYQMLGQALLDPHGVEHGGELAGMGLLPVRTVFSREKTRAQVTGSFENGLTGLFAGLSGAPACGYELHMGETISPRPLTRLQTAGAIPKLHADGAIAGTVCGTYLHGLFERAKTVEALIGCLCRAKGIDPTGLTAVDADVHRERQFDLLASGVREAIEIDKIYRILEAGI